MSSSGKLLKIQKLFIILTILKEIFYRGQNFNSLAENQVQNSSTSRGRHLSALGCGHVWWFFNFKNVFEKAIVPLVDWTKKLSFFHRMSNMSAISSKSLGDDMSWRRCSPLKYIRYFPLSPILNCCYKHWRILIKLLIHSASLFSGHIRHTPNNDIEYAQSRGRKLLTDKCLHFTYYSSHFFMRNVIFWTKNRSCFWQLLNVQRMLFIIS